MGMPHFKKAPYHGETWGIHIVDRIGHGIYLDELSWSPCDVTGMMVYIWGITKRPYDNSCFSGWWIIIQPEIDVDAKNCQFPGAANLAAPDWWQGLRSFGGWQMVDNMGWDCPTTDDLPQLVAICWWENEVSYNLGYETNCTEFSLWFMIRVYYQELGVSRASCWGVNKNTGWTNKDVNGLVSLVQHATNIDQHVCRCLRFPTIAVPRALKTSTIQCWYHWIPNW